MSLVTKLLLSFLPRHLRHEVRELYLSTLILNFALVMQLFEPIYLFTIGYTVQEIIFFFLIVYVLYFFILPIGANYTRHHGTERSIVVSTFASILYYLALFSIQFVPFLFYVAALLYAMQKSLYWPAYHADFAKHAAVGEDSREIATMQAIISLVAVVAPFVAGIVLAVWGFGVLFIISAALFILSNAPLLATRERFSPQPSVYGSVYRELFSKKHRRSLYGYLGYGEEAIMMIVWPVYIAVIVQDYFNIGALLGSTMLITVLITLYVGRRCDMRDKVKILHVGSGVNSFVWLVRMMAQNTFSVFIVDTLARISKNIIAVPIGAVTYERAKGRHVLDFIVFFELSLVVGKLIMLLAAYLILFFVPVTSGFYITFMLAALMSLLYILV